MLSTNAGAQPAYTTYPWTMLVMQSPLWLNAMAANQSMTVNANFSITSGVMGVLLRYSDVNNTIYVAFNKSSSQLVTGARYGGVQYQYVPTVFRPPWCLLSQCRAGRMGERDCGESNTSPITLV